MPTRDTPFSAGTPCWVDLLADDPVASKTFYTSVFDWETVTADDEFDGYVTFYAGGRAVAGLVPNRRFPGAPDAWTTFFATDDLDATHAVAREAGAGEVLAPRTVGDLGRSALLVDPAGATFGLWEAAGHPGFRRHGEPGSVVWTEAHSTDFAASSSFYPTVFDWHVRTLADTDDFRYVQAVVDGETVAGLMDSTGFLAPGVPSHWAVYFGVADVDAAVARVVAAGGGVVHEAKDTPFGRVAHVTDPHGAGFRLHRGVTG